jgi:hypothetical protein
VWHLACHLVGGPEGLDNLFTQLIIKVLPAVTTVPSSHQIDHITFVITTSKSSMPLEEIKFYKLYRRKSTERQFAIERIERCYELLDLEGMGAVVADMRLVLIFLGFQFHLNNSFRQTGWHASRSDIRRRSLQSPTLSNWNSKEFLGIPRNLLVRVLRV